MSIYAFILAWLIPVSDKSLRAFVGYDLFYLHLISFVAFTSLGSILFLRWKNNPVGLIYWVIASLPVLTGTVLGIRQYDGILHQMGYSGIVGPRTLNDMLVDGVLTIHFGLILTLALYGVVLLLHGVDLILRLPEADASIRRSPGSFRS